MKVSIKKVKNIPTPENNNGGFYVEGVSKNYVSSKDFEQTQGVKLPNKLADFIDNRINNLKDGETILITHAT